MGFTNAWVQIGHVPRGSLPTHGSMSATSTVASPNAQVQRSHVARGSCGCMGPPRPRVTKGTIREACWRRSLHAGPARRGLPSHEGFRGNCGHPTQWVLRAASRSRVARASRGILRGPLPRRSPAKRNQGKGGVGRWCSAMRRDIVSPHASYLSQAA